MPKVDCCAPQYNAVDIVQLVRLCRDPVLKVLFMVLRQMHDIGHARHTHECGTGEEATGIKHLRCYLCCWRRLLTSPVLVQEYRRSTPSV